MFLIELTVYAKTEKFLDLILLFMTINQSEIIVFYIVLHGLGFT